MPRASSPISLVSIAGPSHVSLDLTPPGPLTIGRRASHSLALLGDEHVSRDHAVLLYQPESAVASTRKPGTTTTLASSGRWLIRDAGSRHGTWVNGVRLEPGRECPIEPGDLIVLAPWTFQVSGPGAAAPSTLRLSTFDDASIDGTSIKRISAAPGRPAAQLRLDLLLDCAAALHAAPDEQALAEGVLDAALAGTGFANGALLRPTGSADDVEVVAHRGLIVRGAPAPAAGPLQTIGFGPGPRLSRSLIAEAAMGQPAILVASADAPPDAYSVVQLGIEEAMCIPVMLGPAVSAFLYLDNRRAGNHDSSAAPDAAEFAVGLARLAAMALANIKRAELERRQGALEAEMAAAAEAQRWILPQREGSAGPISWIGESRPGRGVGGDFFDVIPLDNGRVAVAVGDVTGKGVAASVLMTATQGFLNAALQRHGDPGQAVLELNRFVHPRTPAHRFVTLWVGVFNHLARTLTYVDAGHGYAWLRHADGSIQRLDHGALPPLGVQPFDSSHAATIPLAPGDMTIVVSDGFVEQPGAGASGPDRRPFGDDGVCQCLAENPTDPVARLFEAVERHAASKQLADDATAVIVRS